MNMEPPTYVESRFRESRPHGWCFEEPATLSVGNGKVVDSSNAARFAEFSDRCDEPFGPGIKRVPWNRLPVALAPLHCI
jgi:hypothetical protein